MKDRIRFSEEADEKIDWIAKKLGTSKNIICRIAFSASISNEDEYQIPEGRKLGKFDINKPTLMGDDEYLFRALLIQLEGRRISDDEFMPMMRNHIERGVEFLYADYQRINSPTDFIIRFLT